MAKAIKNGQKVACVTATKGVAGKTADQQKWPQEYLGRIRETEMGQALSIIGVHDFYWMGYEDGKLSIADKKQAVKKLVKLIDDICPDTILTFEPEGITGHADHKTICAWTCAAAKQSARQPSVYGACESKERYEKVGRDCNKQFDIYYKTDKPFVIAEADADLTLKLSHNEARQKMAALKAHESQMFQFFSQSPGKKYLDKLCSVECFIKL